MLIWPSHLLLGLPKGLFPVGLPVNILKAFLYIRRMVQTMKFLVVEPSPLPILILLGSKYSPRDPVFKYPCTYFKRYLPRILIAFSITHIVPVGLIQGIRPWVLKWNFPHFSFMIEVYCINKALFLNSIVIRKHLLDLEIGAVLFLLQLPKFVL